MTYSPSTRMVVGYRKPPAPELEIVIPLPEKRICQFGICETILAQKNTGDMCFRHQAEMLDLAIEKETREHHPVIAGSDESGCMDCGAKLGKYNNTWLCRSCGNKHKVEHQRMKRRICLPMPRYLSPVDYRGAA